MDLFQALQCRAMLAVEQPDRQAWLRHVMRWYSRSFSTPLHEVEELPLEYVLQHYYEARFEELEDQDRAEHLERLTETDEARARREQTEKDAERAGDDLYEQLNRQVKEDAERSKDMPKQRQPGQGKRRGKARSLAQNKPSVAAQAAPDVVEMQFDDGGNLVGSVGPDQDPLFRDPPRKKA